MLVPGPHNAITDVAGVRVGHFTLRRPPRFNTGVTAVLPHGGNLFHDKVPAAIVVGNGHCHRVRSFVHRREGEAGLVSGGDRLPVVGADLPQIRVRVAAARFVEGGS